MLDFARRAEPDIPSAGAEIVHIHAGLAVLQEAGRIEAVAAHMLVAGLAVENGVGSLLLVESAVKDTRHMVAVGSWRLVGSGAGDIRLSIAGLGMHRGRLLLLEWEIERVSWEELLGSLAALEEWGMRRSWVADGLVLRKYLLGIRLEQIL
jgi:hypothetical protein